MSSPEAHCPHPFLTLLTGSFPRRPPCAQAPGQQPDHWKHTLSAGGTDRPHQSVRTPHPWPCHSPLAPLIPGPVTHPWHPSSLALSLTPGTPHPWPCHSPLAPLIPGPVTHPWHPSSLALSLTPGTPHPRPCHSPLAPHIPGPVTHPWHPWHGRIGTVTVQESLYPASPQPHQPLFFREREVP